MSAFKIHDNSLHRRKFDKRFFARSVFLLTSFFITHHVHAQTSSVDPEFTLDTDFKSELAAPPKIELTAVPPGFESLMEPQTTLVDIYLNGEYLTSQLATFSPDDITLSNSSEVVEHIPSLLDPLIVEYELSKTLDNNSSLNCYYSGQQDCGALEPEVAGVIFNSDTFRVDLFINSNLLAIGRIAQNKYLPASSSNWSLLQSFSAAYAGSDQPNITDTYAIGSGTTLAFRENRFLLVSNYEDHNKYNFDTAVIRRDWEGMEYQMGYFRSNSGNFQFMSDAPLRGLRVATSLDTREDLRQTSGNELQVFLSTRSEVRLYKDDRLLSSRFYDPGNQVLDTSTLPGGAYDVRLEILDASGVKREETRFYIKSSQLPPQDQALFFVEAGELLNSEDRDGFADSTNLALFRTGYERRLTDQLGLMAGLSQVDQTSSVELGITHLGRFHDVSIGGFGANEKRHGARANFRLRVASSYVNFNYRRVWNEDYDPNDPADLYGESNVQSSLGVSSQFSFGRIELNGRVNRREHDTIETYTARYDLPSIPVGLAETYIGFQVGREEEATTILANFEMRFNTDHFTGQIRPEFSRRKDGNKLAHDNWQTSGVLSWHDRDILPDQDLRVDVRGLRNGDTSSMGGEIDLASQTGRLRLQSEHVNNNGEASRRYNGNAFTSFMINDKNAKLGGREQSQSAVLVGVRGLVSDAVFDIIVDGSTRGVAKANKLTALNLRPYETYSIKLVQRGSSFVDYDQREREVTLYPGNVVSLEWDVAEMDVVFGRIVDANNQYIPNALLAGVNGISTTDDLGLFQAEIRRDTKSISIQTRDSLCEVSLPAYEVNNHIGNLGTLSCDLQPK